MRLFFKIKTQKFQDFFLLAVKGKSHFSVRVMAHTVQLLRHDSYCPIKAEIRAVDSQSDLKILRIVKGLIVKCLLVVSLPIDFSFCLFVEER